MKRTYVNYLPPPSDAAVERAAQSRNGIACPECSKLITPEQPVHAEKCRLRAELESAIKRFDQTNWPPMVSRRHAISYAEALRLCPNVTGVAKSGVSQPASNLPGNSITCPECKVNITAINPTHSRGCVLALALKSALKSSPDGANWKPLIATSAGRYEISHADARRLCPDDSSGGITCPWCARFITQGRPDHTEVCQLRAVLAAALQRVPQDSWPPYTITSNGRYAISYTEALRLCPDVITPAQREMLNSHQLASETVEAAERAGASTTGMKEAFVLERAAEAALLEQTLLLIAPHLDTILSPIPWAEIGKGCRLLGPKSPDEQPDKTHVQALYIGRAADHGVSLIGVLYTQTRPGYWTNEWKGISSADACFAWRLPAILAALHDAFFRVAEGGADRRAAEARERAEMLNAIATLVRGMRAQPPAGAGKKSAVGKSAKGT